MLALIPAQIRPTLGRVVTIALVAGFGAVVACTGVAPAQEKSRPERAPQSRETLPGPPAALPARPSGERGGGIDFLLGALKAAPDEASARHVEARIWALWATTQSDTAGLLMTRAKTALDAKNYDLALRLLDAVVKVRPDYIEGWNRRATVRYLKNDYVEAIADIQQVLIREPRHFGALAGLGMILQEIGDDRRALDVLRRALVLNPHLERIPDMVKALAEKVEGRDI